MSGSKEGLSGVEAARRLAAYGPNEPVPVRRPSAVVQLFHLFANPLVIILLVASVIAGSLGQHVDALIIVTMIPGDNVDNAYLRRPQRWDMRVIRDFMVFIGPISSIFDFLTFYVLLRYLHARESLFRTGWFVESLATQTLVLFVIRTMGSPFQSRPSRSLTVTTLVIVAIGAVLPVTPLATFLGFARLPVSYFAFLIPAILTYLVMVDVAKRQLVRRLGL